jgi:hypothetical protein
MALIRGRGQSQRTQADQTHQTCSSAASDEPQHPCFPGLERPCLARFIGQVSSVGRVVAYASNGGCSQRLPHCIHKAWEALRAWRTPTKRERVMVGMAVSVWLGKGETWRNGERPQPITHRLSAVPFTIRNHRQAFQPSQPRPPRYLYMSGVPYDGGGLDQIQITVVTSWPPAHHVIHIHQAFHGQCRSQPVADHPTKKPRESQLQLG